MSNIPKNTDPACVEAALKATPGVGEVSEMQTYGSGSERRLSWEYGGEHSAVLELSEHIGEWRYLNTNTHMGRDDSGAAFAPLMLRVNASVDATCATAIVATGEVDIIRRGS